MRCKGCHSEIEPVKHCAGSGCGWCICPECGATNDAMSSDPDAYFAKRPETPRKAG